ncbi:hypothetical protein ACHAXA_008780 [Cyclostephanos tholiformis]|uniref:Sulfotransferase domain-containing protein n=1 Tax=Cyclostephanos tholiformis TaxID=382380 RepID=A0ABD3SBG6_9STRA
MIPDNSRRVQFTTNTINNDRSNNFTMATVSVNSTSDRSSGVDDGSDRSFAGSRRVSNASSNSSGSSRRASNDASDYGASTNSQQLRLQQQQQQQRQHHQQQRRHPPPALAASVVDSDVLSLAAALAQSIRHHSRMINGDRQDPLIIGGSGRVPGGRGVVATGRMSSYDPYQDDDQVTLAPDVELNYDNDAAARKGGGGLVGNNVTPLRDFVANTAIGDVAPMTTAQRATRGDGANIQGIIDRQQRRMDMLHQGEYSFGARLTRNISNWFGMDGASASGCSAKAPPSGGEGSGRTVRFAGVDGDDPAGFAALIADPGGATVPFDPRAPKFVVPPPASFRTATRHPSHLPASSEFNDMEARLDAPRRMLEARKRYRRNDSMLRLMIAVLCFGVSLLFAIVYGEGKFGLAVTTMAYERKVEGRADLSDKLEAHELMEEMMMKEEVVYPDWWEQEAGIPDMEGKDIKFSPTLEYYAADVTTPRAPDRIETPFFWTIPRSGGNVVRTIMSNCLRLAEASELGAGSDQPFLIVEERGDKRFVNVDMTTTEGLARASSLKIASSGVPDVIISGDIHGVLQLFNNRNRVRIFAVFRHPMERAISKYYADLESDPEVAGMTLPQYIRSGGYRVENNYLTRYLSGRYGGNLMLYHLDIAREFIRRKFVVGLASDLPTTADMFSYVFGWNNSTNLGQENVYLCYNNIYSALSRKPPPMVQEGSEGWKLLIAQNWFDLKLYEYVEHLFKLQLDQLKLTKSS